MRLSLRHISCLLACLLCQSFLAGGIFAAPVEQRAGYRVEAVRVPVSLGDTADAYLLVPDHARRHKCPAIVAFHDHGARFTIGKEKLCFPLDSALQTEAKAWVCKFYEGAFVADSLAANGFVVLVIDALYWGSRRPNTDMTNKQLKAYQPDFYQQHLQATGQPWFETILADDKASVNYLLSRPEVNRKRIGVWGFSMGAYRAWQLASEDKRIAFCAASNWMTSREAQIAAGADPAAWQLVNVSSYSMYRPAMDSLDYGAIAARIAPRPLLLQYGTSDPLFPPANHVQPAWKALRMETFDYKHFFSHNHLTHLISWLRNYQK